MKTIYFICSIFIFPIGVFAWEPLPVTFDFSTFKVFAEPGNRIERGNEQKASLAGYISVWTQNCDSNSCSLPQPAMPARKIGFEIGLPAAPGQARRKEVVESFPLPDGGEFKVTLNFYALCPYGWQGGCPAYFQVQAGLSGAADAFCAASLNTGDFLPFPVFVCAGIPAPGKRLGITLHRTPF